MLLKVHGIAAWLVVALGTIHTASTPLFYKSAKGALWFAGAGLAAVFAGLLNLALKKTLAHDRYQRRVCGTANVLFVAYALLLAILVREPQTILAFVLAVVLTVATLRLAGVPDEAR